MTSRENLKRIAELAVSLNEVEKTSKILEERGSSEKEIAEFLFACWVIRNCK
jgi:hypothetical protein